MLFRTSTCLRANEEFSLCGWRCPATCVNLRMLSRDLCPSTWECRIGCRCSAGFIRDEYSKQCVMVQHCPVQEACLSLGSFKGMRQMDRSGAKWAPKP
ncbi:hypothetical protein PYW07_003746 [Mythimna separata]|uniref:TIL domain-containing protein n=1 Tax=Mythimna separata TaxID=271217 RepID=A0AAD8DUE7_MYTSE|nr:hypothetical protein PYW07_003746 [Mythimna separata]